MSHFATQHGNRLLELLPPDVYDRLRGRLRPVGLKLKQVLYDARATIEHVYFPRSACASTLTVMRDGSAIEVAMVGYEGLVGSQSLFGAGMSPNKVIVQIHGEALRMEAADLRDELTRDEPLRNVLLRYQTTFLLQMSQSVACNGLHHVHQRCCRWLLMTHDRARTDEFEITHEFLALMLGVRRASVSEVLKPLHDSGMIHCGRGMIKVLDRARLEAASCECYRTVVEDYDRLLSPVT